MVTPPLYMRWWGLSENNIMILDGAFMRYISLIIFI